MLDQIKEYRLNILDNIDDWNVDEWIIGSTESLSQYADRIKIMDQFLDIPEISSEKTDEIINVEEIRTLPMKFYGEEFSQDDIITLEKEDNNNTDPNAIRVYQTKNGHKVHVSYVCKEDSKRIRYIPNFEKKVLKLVEVNNMWSRFKFC